MVNDIVKSIIQNNDYRKLRLTSAGTKVMAKQEAGKGIDAQFRILGEGLPIILPFINESSIVISDMPPLRTLLTTYYPLISSFDAPFRETMQGRCKWHSYIKFKAFSVHPKAMGSHVVKFLPVIADNIRYVEQIDVSNVLKVINRLDHELVLPIWKSNVSLTLMIDKKAKRFSFNPSYIPKKLT